MPRIVNIITIQLDRNAVDCAKELRNHDVASVSLWPGIVHTEYVTDILETKGDRIDPSTGIKVGYAYNVNEGGIREMDP